MKGVVIYKGRYGATKQYAVWIGKELGLTIASADRFPQDELQHYDYFIIGSSVYIGKLEIKNWLKNNFNFLLSKKIFLFQVAGTSVSEKEKRDSYNKIAIPPSILNRADTYFFPGRMIVKNLSMYDRFMLKMGARLTKDPNHKKEMLTDYDNVKKEQIDPLIEAVKKIAEIAEPAIELVRI